MNIILKSPRVESNVDDNDFKDEDIVMITRKYRRVFNKPSERRRFKDFKRENFKWKKKRMRQLFILSSKIPVV